MDVVAEYLYVLEEVVVHGLPTFACRFVISRDVFTMVVRIWICHNDSSHEYRPGREALEKFFICLWFPNFRQEKLP